MILSTSVCEVEYLYLKGAGEFSCTIDLDLLINKTIA
jgi:hypothetical protein